MPKEMLTVVDKPADPVRGGSPAAAAGITDMIFVTGRNKRAIEDHFDRAYELERTSWNAPASRRCLTSRRRRFRVQYQLHISPRGDAPASAMVLCAQPVVVMKPFAVILADELAFAPPTAALARAVPRAQLAGICHRLAAAPATVVVA